MSFINRFTLFIMAALMLGVLSSESGAAEPVRETITYQGHLNDGGEPANGMYDIRLQYYDELGVPFGTILTYLEFEIVDGLMSFPIDFTNVFTFGQRRFLEISVRPAGVGVFTDLSPRTEITAAPYSVYAIKAGEADIADISLDNEWSRSGTTLSTGSGADQMLIKPELTSGFLLNAVTEMQLNFDDSNFGGIYINSQNSGGAPFYGFAHDSLTAAYIEYRESLDQIRFFNSGETLPVLTLGNTTATVQKLAAETEVVKDFGTNEYHRNGPIAYGAFDFDGSQMSGTPNINAVWSGGSARYIVSVDGEPLNFQLYTAVVTPISTTPVLGTTSSFSGDLVVYFHNLTGSKIQSQFNIAIYKNAAVSVD